MSCDRHSRAAGVALEALLVPMSRAGFETRSKKRLMLAAHHPTEGLVRAIGLFDGKESGMPTILFPDGVILARPFFRRSECLP